MLVSGGVSLELASLRQSRSLIRLTLRSSAHTEGGGEQKIPKTNTEKTRTRHGVSLFFCVFVPDPASPVLAGPRSAETSGSGLALFERSEFSQTPLGSSTAGCPVAKRRGPRLRVAFLLGTFLWRSKEKCLACRATPASKPQHNYQGTINNAASTSSARTGGVRTTRLRQTQPERVGGELPSFDKLSPIGQGQHFDRGTPCPEPVQQITTDPTATANPKPPYAPHKPPQPHTAAPRRCPTSSSL